MDTEFDTQEADSYLEAWRANLPTPEPPLVQPAWADADARPVARYMMRGRLCYVFAFKPSVDGVDGFVLDTEALLPYPVWRGNLAVALSLVGVT